jgi:hypothetical protein
MSTTTSRRNALALVATLPALAAPAALAAAPTDPDAMKRAAALERAEQVVDSFRTRYVCADWKCDEEGAERMLRYFRRYVEVPDTGNDDDDPEFFAAIDFLSSHGQSLDWVFDGNPVGMICGAAKRSAYHRDALASDPIYAAIDARRLALAKWMTTPEEPAEEYDTAGNADAEAIRKLFTTVPTTLGGVKALLAYIVECEEQGDTICETYLEQDGYELCSNMLPVTLHAAIERLCEATA